MTSGMPDVDTLERARERFLAKVATNPDGCWLWTAHIGRHGYGGFRIGGKWQLAHRVGWWLHRGEIPDGLVLDHLCRVRRCVNPEHLEAVTLAENIRRGIAGEVNAARHLAKTHCPHGHPYDEADTGRRPDGRRTCRACRRDRWHRRASR